MKIKLPKSNLIKYKAIEEETIKEIDQLKNAIESKKDELSKLQTLIKAHEGMENKVS